MQINTENKYVIVDVRSEGEFQTDKIPNAINIPILNNQERHDVGILYKMQSQDSAVEYAYSIAKKKEDFFIQQFKKIIDKKIIIYCWRGGGRSRYVFQLLKRYGLDGNLQILIGGQKAFRKTVYQILYETKLTVVSLSGQTGCGKSELLEYLQEKHPSFPVIHIEKCAWHASSVFGAVRFNNIKERTHLTQQEFETNLFLELNKFIGQSLDQVLKEKHSPIIFLSEKESRKIGNCNIPPSIFNALQEEKHIEVTCDLKERITRLKYEYFTDQPNIEIKQSIINDSKHLTRKMGAEKIGQYEKWINENNFDSFLEDILISYYDKVYKKTSAPPLAKVHHNGEPFLSICATEFQKVFNEYLQKQKKQQSQ